MTRMISPTLVFAFSLLASACGTQTDSQYNGERLFRVTGQVTNEVPGALQGEVTIHWMFDNGEGASEVVQIANVEGDFPASFTLDLYQPPTLPPATHLAVGIVVAIDPAVYGMWDDTAGEVDYTAGIIGSAEGNVLIWTDGSVLACDSHETLCEAERDVVDAIGTTSPEAGYQLLEVLPDSAADDDEWIELEVAAPDTRIEVRMAPARDLFFPTWT